MIYIATHKEVCTPELDNYILLRVGAGLNGVQEGLQDNTGEHISEKNKDFCELTGLYWIWKNTKDEYKGLVHYRRFFAKSNLKSDYEMIYSYKELCQKLENTDMILPYVEYFKTNAKEELLTQCCTKEIFDIMEAIVKEKNPAYMPDFENYFSGNRSVLFNMMFCTAEKYDAYCEWLFPILFELEEQIEAKEIAYPPRLYGYLAERLLNVWILHQQLKTIHVGVLNTELDSVNRIRLLRRRITNRIWFGLKKT